MPDHYKKDLTEQEIRSRFITPAILQSGWDPHQVREDYFFTAGHIQYNGTTHKRTPGKFADYHHMIIERESQHPASEDGRAKFHMMEAAKVIPVLSCGKLRELRSYSIGRRRKHNGE